MIFFSKNKSIVLFLLSIFLVYLSCNGFDQKKDFNLNVHNSIKSENYYDSIFVKDDTLEVILKSKLNYIDDGSYFFISNLIFSKMEKDIQYFPFIRLNFYSDNTLRYNTLYSPLEIERMSIGLNYKPFNELVHYVVDSIWLTDILDYHRKLNEFYFAFTVPEEKRKNFTEVIIGAFKECLISNCKGLNNELLYNLSQFYVIDDLYPNKEKYRKITKLMDILNEIDMNDVNLKLNEVFKNLPDYNTDSVVHTTVII